MIGHTTEKSSEIIGIETMMGPLIGKTYVLDSFHYVFTRIATLAINTISYDVFGTAFQTGHDKKTAHTVSNNLYFLHLLFLDASMKWPDASTKPSGDPFLSWL
ncbi:MAG: hypothetical protein OXE77_07265 [Flavobacteriaceae bacterium]|nr:hypothetical protein [Flavobacteriaceae bacterium]MCY4267034.1 hypothetical protein [Flavobacteriaceae bacterium]MCY4298195.1 hypothetical protein [Flavobacteriaceae bacterium]